MSSSVIPAAPVPGEPYVKLLVLINGTVLCRMSIDTGATKTVITPLVRQSLGIGTRPVLARVAGSTRAQPVAAARLASLQIEGFPETRVDGLSVLVMDLPFADGVLGLDYLSKFTEVCYNFQARVLRLTRDL